MSVDVSGWIALLISLRRIGFRVSPAAFTGDPLPVLFLLFRRSCSFICLIAFLIFPDFSFLLLFSFVHLVVLSTSLSPPLVPRRFMELALQFKAAKADDGKEEEPDLNTRQAVNRWLEAGSEKTVGLRFHARLLPLRPCVSSLSCGTPFMPVF